MRQVAAAAQRGNVPQLGTPTKMQRVQVAARWTHRLFRCGKSGMHPRSLRTVHIGLDSSYIGTTRTCRSSFCMLVCGV